MKTTTEVTKNKSDVKPIKKINKKYTLIPTTIDYCDGTLDVYQIKALIDISEHGVKKGDLGGYIQSEKNLSQDGNCWVGGTSYVIENARVYGDAIVRGKCDIFGDAEIYDRAVVDGQQIVISDYVQVYGDARIEGSTEMGGYAKVFDKASVSGKSGIGDFAMVFENSDVYSCEIFGNAKVYGKAVVSKSTVKNDAEVFGCADIDEHCIIRQNSKVFEFAYLRCRVDIGGTVVVCGKSTITSPITVRGDAIIENTSDIIIFNCWWSDNGSNFCWTKSNNKFTSMLYCETPDELIYRQVMDNYEICIHYVLIVKYTQDVLKLYK